MTEPDRVPVAYVRRAHGIRGDVVVRGLGADGPNRLAAGSSLEQDGGRQPLLIVRSQPHGEDFLLHLEGIDDRTAAEALVGTQFTIDRADRRDLDDDEWWIEDVVGCAVVDVDGGAIGTVTGVAVGAAQDRLVVETPTGETAEIPLVDELIPDVDVASRRIVANPPAGLFDEGSG